MCCQRRLTHFLRPTSDGRILCLSSPYFDAALSGNWKEGQSQNAAISGAEAETTATNNDGGPREGPARGPIRFVMEMPKEEPAVINDMLCFLYPHLKLELHKDRWARLSTLADMTEIQGLFSACREYAVEQAARDPVSILREATFFRMRSLFQQCCEHILEDFDTHKQQEGYACLAPEVRLLVSPVHKFDSPLQHLSANTSFAPNRTLPCIEARN